VLYYIKNKESYVSVVLH